MKTIVTLTPWLLINAALSLGWTDHHSGIIRSIDWPTRQVVLDDGATYTVRRGINLAKFAIGEKVTLRTEDENGTEIVTTVTKGEYVPPQPKQSGRNRKFP
jgi:hypothetical protein